MSGCALIGRWGRRGTSGVLALIGLLAGLGLLGGCGTARMQSKVLVDRSVSLDHGVVLVKLSDDMEPETCDRFEKALTAELRACGLDIPVEVSGCFSTHTPVPTDSLLARYPGRTILLLSQGGTILDGNDVKGFMMNAYLMDGPSREIVWRGTGRASSSFWKVGDAIRSYVDELFQTLVDDGVITCRNRYRKRGVDAGVS